LRLIANISDAAYTHAARRARRLPRVLWATDSKTTATRRSIRYHLDLRDNVQRTIYFTGWYERRYIRALCSLAGPGSVFIDIGAHIGVHSIALARRLSQMSGNGKVYSLEPVSKTFNILRANVAANGLRNVQTCKVLLGSTSGEVSISQDTDAFEPEDAAVYSVFGPGETVERAHMQTFDDWVDSNELSRIDVIKIDVEGAEFSILKGMERSIAKYRPAWIGIEIRDYLLKRAGVSELELRNWLRAHEYHAVEFGDMEGNFLFQRVER
jgi:FkbM family methyltransferase